MLFIQKQEFVSNLKLLNGSVCKTFFYITFTQYFEAPLAAIAASSRLGYDATSLAHQYFGRFSHSSLEQVFIKDLLVIFSARLSLDPD